MERNDWSSQERVEESKSPHRHQALRGQDYPRSTLDYMKYPTQQQRPTYSNSITQLDAQSPIPNQQQQYRINRLSTQNKAEQQHGSQ